MVVVVVVVVNFLFCWWRCFRCLCCGITCQVCDGGLQVVQADQQRYEAGVLEVLLGSRYHPIPLLTFSPLLVFRVVLRIYTAHGLCFFLVLYGPDDIFVSPLWQRARNRYASKYRFYPSASHAYVHMGYDTRLYKWSVFR